MIPDNEDAAGILRAIGTAEVRHEAQLIAVALAAEALHRGWLALENALNAWRATITTQ